MAVRSGNLLLPIVLLLLVCPKWAHGEVFPSKIEILDLLRSGSYADLEVQLTALQEGFESGEVSEALVDHAFLAFKNTDPELEERLDTWIATFPGSFAAVAARGVYYFQVGWHRRGHRYISDTSSERRRDLKHYENMAWRDLQLAVTRRPKFSVGYARLIDIADLSRGRDDEDKVFAKARALVPYSALVHHRILFARLPRWGGSLREFDQIVEMIRENFVDDRNSAYLRGFGFYARALTARLNGDNSAAGKWISKALVVGSHWTFHFEKAKILDRKGRLEAALEQYGRAIELRPEVASLLDKRALLYEKLGDLDKALVDWDRALEVDSFHPYILRHRGNVRRRQGSFQAAKEDFDRAMVHGKLEARIQYSRGRLYLDDLKDFKEAAVSLGMAAELADTKPDYWYAYARALDSLLDCKIEDALWRYLELCAKQMDCDTSMMWVAIKKLSLLSYHNDCPDN